MFSWTYDKMSLLHLRLNLSMLSDALIMGKTEHWKNVCLELAGISDVLTGLVQVSGEKISERKFHLGQGNFWLGIILLLYIFSFSNGCMCVEKNKNSLAKHYFCSSGALTFPPMLFMWQHGGYPNKESDNVSFWSVELKFNCLILITGNSTTKCHHTQVFREGSLWHSLVWCKALSFLLFLLLLAFLFILFCFCFVFSIQFCSSVAFSGNQRDFHHEVK